MERTHALSWQTSHHNRTSALPRLTYLNNPGLRLQSERGLAITMRASSYAVICLCIFLFFFVFICCRFAFAVHVGMLHKCGKECETERNKWNKVRGVSCRWFERIRSLMSCTYAGRRCTFVHVNRHEWVREKREKTMERIKLELLRLRQRDREEQRNGLSVLF